jgi:tRNA nucleotidyltransferase (CCA-adding enzyme)
MITLNPVEKKIVKLLLNCVADNQLQATLRIAGGWVRDKLLFIESHDLDIVIDKMNGLDFASVLDEYSRSKNLKIGSIGRIKINPDKSKHLETATLSLFGKDVDFVGLRHEVEYTPESRNPIIASGTPEQDAFRRDITINSLFYNIHSREIEDFTGKVNCLSKL